MPFTPPVAEQRFVLDHVAELRDLVASDRFAAASDDVVEAVLNGVGDFASGEWAPLNRSGDTIGAVWEAGSVRMPPGYGDAYRAYIENGWGTIGVPERFGGQGLPFIIQMAVQETLGTANLGFALCPLLTAGAIEALIHHGSVEQQRTYLPKLASGEWTGTMNLTEPQAGSDVGALRAIATPRGDGAWSIKGTKIFISFSRARRRRRRGRAAYRCSSCPRCGSTAQPTTFASSRSNTRWACTHRRPAFSPSAKTTIASAS